MKKSILFVELIYLHYVISACSVDPPIVPEGAFSDWDNSTKAAGTLVTYTCLTGKQVKAVCEAASMTWKPTSIICLDNRRGGEVKKINKGQMGKKGKKGKRGKRGKKKIGKKPARKPGKKPGRGKTESCRCGIKETSRIVNGQNAEEFDWPWIVRLKIGEYIGPYIEGPSLENVNPSRCGGSLIADQWILTAAHCYWGETITVFLGDHHSFYNYEWSTDQNEKIITVDKIIVHAYWYSKYGLHDIALLKLSEKVDMTKYTPVCLPDAESTYVGKMADVYGWGHTSYQGEGAYILQEASVEVRENQVCIDKPYLMTKWQLCAFTNGTDTCQGDSGGPMTIYDNGQHKQIGIVSYGDGCGTYPGVYTRVSEYVDWIKAQIGANGGAEYCSM